MDRYTHADVCGDSEPEYTNSRKYFILGPKLKEGTTSFQFSSRGNGEFLKQLRVKQMFFQHTLPISRATPPGW